MNVKLHIEELILHGFAPQDRYRIAQAVESELARLLAENEPPRSLSKSVEIPSLDVGTFEVVMDSTPNSIGVQIAQSLHRGLVR